MRRFAVTSCLSLAVCGWLALAPSVRADDRTAEQILKEINAVEMPQFDPAQRENQEAINRYLTQRREAMNRRAELIGELYKKDPNHAELDRLMVERWQAMMMSGPQKVRELQAEFDEIQNHSKNDSLKTTAAFWKAIIALRTGPGDPDTALKAAETFIKSAPKDERGSQLLYMIADQTEDTAKQTTLLKRIVKDYPDSRVAKMAEGSLKRLESIGKPFDLEFTEAVKGTEISMKGLKGKVVVIDFWATWCGPCVAEMPNMKKLYAEYRDKGVEFIGVSLDQPKDEGGLDKLKEFVAKNEIAWPQYYQGNGWESEFSRSWGINSIPAVFVIDAEGKLYSVEARGKLEDMIPELLKKAKVKAEAGAGGN
jgi:thiol-disulfide isomerase/thioredoxin